LGQFYLISWTKADGYHLMNPFIINLIFSGYFSLINEKGSPTATLYTTMIQLVRERVYKFLSVDNMQAYTESSSTGELLESSTHFWKFWQFWKKNFDSLKRKILTVWKIKFWQFEKINWVSSPFLMNKLPHGIFNRGFEYQKMQITKTAHFIFIFNQHPNKIFFVLNHFQIICRANLITLK
jgi:hypothetical protein